MNGAPIRQRSKLTLALKLYLFMALAASSCAAYGQCAERNYVQDGTPSAMRDCQPLATLTRLSPEAMSTANADLVSARHAEMVAAAHFYGFDIESAGWTYQQAVSSLLRKHVLLVFTNATPLSRASHFTALVPTDSSERVQVVPAFSRGLRPYLPGWESKGTYTVFNRLMRSEVGPRPVSTESDWIQYAVLYLTLIGREPSVPTETDSVKANWDLSVKRGTTPVIAIQTNGAATIICSDLADATRTTSWKLIFDKQGSILKAERSETGLGKVRNIPIATGPDGQVKSISMQQ